MPRQLTTRNDHMGKVFKLIETEAEYEALLEQIYERFEADPDTPEGQELEVMSLIVKEYEDRKYPILPPDPIEAIKIRMEELGMKDQQSLVPFIGPKSRVSEVLNRKRPLSLKMIYRLHQGLQIPLEVFVNERTVAQEYLSNPSS